MPRPDTEFEDGGQLWRAGELDKLKRLLKSCTSTAQIYERFACRSPDSIRKQCLRTFPELYARFARRGVQVNFTEAEDAYILANYYRPGHSASTIAQALGRESRCSIISRASRLRREGKLSPPSKRVSLPGSSNGLDKSRAPL